jgi:signal transduction histidine kinase
MPYREADILALNINMLFSRIDKHIKQLDAQGQQSLEHSQALENKINKRTDALKESNQELLSTLEKLHQFQSQLVESEKMASLGDMVAGVAHEVNTPIGLGVTASTLLADRLDEIKHAFDNKTLKSSQLKKFLHDSCENVAIIYRNLNRAANLISSFKKVAVDQSSEDLRTFDVKQLLNEVLLILKPQLNVLPYIIDIDCPNDLTINSKPGPINQILINLIMNSIIHGFEGKDKGRISITVISLSNQLNILYKDDGIGVAESIKHKVFEPFTTTKRGEGGSGLGLHLVYNLVTQALGGSIVLSSELDHGVSIEINFPINK